MEQHRGDAFQCTLAPLHGSIFPEEEEEDHADPMDCDTDDDLAAGAGPSGTFPAASRSHGGGSGGGDDNATPTVPFAYPSKEDIANWRKNCGIQKRGQAA